ncbi:MAG: DNA-3-methyladenine glycosylase I [Actinomycetota bacterium]
MNQQWVRIGDDGRARCWWPGEADDYVEYHDEEWGHPVVDDVRLFEKICLEGFQSGLSWLTILRKREGFRAAFAGFDPEAMTAYGPADVERLLQDAGIVRHRRKIESAINNAGRVLELIDEFGSFAAYIWSWEPSEREGVGADDEWPIPSATPTSTALAKDLKTRGWSFVGPTTVYAFMQAMGLVNDHLEGCEWRTICEDERAALTVPT